MHYCRFVNCGNILVVGLSLSVLDNVKCMAVMRLWINAASKDAVTKLFHMELQL